MRLFKDDLAELSPFSEASRSQLAEIRRHLTMLTVPAGRVLVEQGKRGDQFMVIVEGEASVSQQGSTIATLGRGDLVGEMALLEDGGAGRRNATVTARTDMVVYAGTPSEFRTILKAAPSVARRVRDTAAARTLARAA
jgi:CRP/FNR family transcriptional regulator, cyclic AMP receptor protein